jgi:hypothetical protein
MTLADLPDCLGVALNARASLGASSSIGRTADFKPPHFRSEIRHTALSAACCLAQWDRIGGPGP